MFVDPCIIANSYRSSQQDATIYQNLLFYVYMKLSTFRATHHPSSGAQNCTSSLWFCICERLLDIEVAGRKLNMFRATHRPSSGAQNCSSSLWFCTCERLLDTVQQLLYPTTFHMCKTRGC
jgi:hypothetical protein